MLRVVENQDAGEAGEELLVLDEIACAGARTRGACSSTVPAPKVTFLVAARPLRTTRARPCSSRALRWRST
jgi:hypothetical protein